MFESIVSWVMNLCFILMTIFLGLSILMVSIGISNKLSKKEEK